MDTEITLAAVVAVALLFDFTNGFHDAANAIATSVSTRAVPPRVAVAAAAAFNFAGAFLSLKVAATVANGIVDPGAITLTVVLAGLVGAIAWNFATWALGLPSSSSHALIGGVLGSSVAAAGTGVVQWHGLYDKVLLPAVYAPALAVPAAGLLMLALRLAVRRRNSDRLFRRLQLFSAGFVALAHGTNDAQKTMGVIALALVVAHPGDGFHVPLWVVLSAATAMAAGTYAGGWRIVETLGKRVVRLDPAAGFAAETTTAAILWTTAHIGLPVSTTHTVTSAIAGAGRGSGRRVDLAVLRGIALAWLVTLPAAAAAGAAAEQLTRLPGGTTAVVALAAALALAAAAAARARRGAVAV
jgi:PiT family inorganic phosphate transporter